jgi:hypothetical protein
MCISVPTSEPTAVLEFPWNLTDSRKYLLRFSQVSLDKLINSFFAQITLENLHRVPTPPDELFQVTIKIFVIDSNVAQTSSIFAAVTPFHHENSLLVGPLGFGCVLKFV